MHTLWEYPDWGDVHIPLTASHSTMGKSDKKTQAAPPQIWPSICLMGHVYTHPTLNTPKFPIAYVSTTGQGRTNILSFSATGTGECPSPSTYWCTQYSSQWNAFFNSISAKYFFPLIIKFCLFPNLF